MKKTLSNMSSSLKRGSFVLGVATFTLANLTSCSNDDINGPSDIDKIMAEQGVAMSINTDTDYLNSLVTNYQTARSRDGESLATIDADFTMPAYTISGTEMTSGSDLTNTDYHIPASADITIGSYTIDGKSWYIEGKVTANEIRFNNSAKIYILPGGSLTLTTPLDTNNDGCLYQYPGSTFSGAIASIGQNSATVYLQGNFTNSTNLSVSGKLYVNGSLTVNGLLSGYGSNPTIKCKGLTANALFIQNQGKIDCDGEVLINGTAEIWTGFKASYYTTNLTLNAQSLTIAPEEGSNVEFRNNDKISVNKSITIESDLTISTQAQLIAKCLDVTRTLSITNVPTLSIDDYIHARSIIIYTSPTFNMKDDALFDAGELFKTTNIGWKINISNSPDKKAVVKATKIEGYNNPYTDPSITGYVDVQYTTKEGYLTVGPNVTENEGIEVAGDPDGCKPGKTEPEENPWTPISVVENPGTHLHPISATCVDFDGEDIFVSWHERGGNIHGCIEWLKLKTDGTPRAEFKAWMETPMWTYGTSTGTTDCDNAYDFNHLIYENGYILTVGDHARKGGFIGQINLADIQGVGDGYDGERNIMLTRQLYYPHSGNAVVKHGNKLYIAGAGGFQTFDWSNPADFTKVKMNEELTLSTDGSAKHIATDGNYVVTINYKEPQSSVNSDPTWNDTWTAHPAQIKIWDLSQGAWLSGTETKTIEVPAFSPQYGKDVIAVSNGRIYSCQGHNGVKVYSTEGGNEIASFNVKDWYQANRDKYSFTYEQHTSLMGNAAANGLAVTDDYVFVAYGGAGVWVLKKDNMKPVAYYIDTNTWESEELGGDYTGASCNYVVVNGDYVYLAYGLGRLQIFQFDKTKAQKEL